MHARPGDHVVVRNRVVGGAVRDAEVLAVEHEDGSPPYRVRWSDNGHEALFFPGPDAHVEPARPEASGESDLAWRQD